MASSTASVAHTIGHACTSILCSQAAFASVLCGLGDPPVADRAVPPPQLPGCVQLPGCIYLGNHHPALQLGVRLHHLTKAFVLCGSIATSVMPLLLCNDPSVMQFENGVAWISWCKSQTGSCGLHSSFHFPLDPITQTVMTNVEGAGDGKCMLRVVHLLAAYLVPYACSARTCSRIQQENSVAVQINISMLQHKYQKHASNPTAARNSIRLDHRQRLFHVVHVTQ